MVRKWFVVVLLLSLGGLTSGCTQLGAGVTASSFPLTSRDSYTVVGESSGKSMAPGFFGMQLWPTSAYDALQDAKKKSGADGVINITADNKVYYIPPVIPVLTVHVMELRGEAVKFERDGKMR